MELKFTLEIDKYDEINDLEEQLLETASEKFIQQVLGNIWNKNDLYFQLENKVIKKLENIMDMDFKKEVATKVTENLTKQFEKSSQYKTLKAGEEIISDSMIKSGLKDIVSEIVKSEMKKLFK